MPQGSGKTLISKQLAQRLGCSEVVEEWWLDLPLREGALHLTNEAVEALL